MRDHRRIFGPLLLLALQLALLVWLSFALSSVTPNFLSWSVFTLLIIFTTAFGVPIGGGLVSLLPMTTAAAFMVFGLVPTAWAALIGALAHGVLRHLFSVDLRERQEMNKGAAINRAATNAAIQSVSVIAGGFVFNLLGGVVPLRHLTIGNLLPIVGCCLIYLVINYLFAGLYFRFRSRDEYRHFLQSLQDSVIFEAGPLVFAPLMALIHNQLGLGFFLLFSISIVVWSMATRNLAFARTHLERRVSELKSLQAVGQALSSSLDLEVILNAIYQQVNSLMQADNFYIGLYDDEADKVSFPLAIENGEKVFWKARKPANGLTEYILRTKAPLLIQGNFEQQIRLLGVAPVGKPAQCWLGVPILAGERLLGAIVVQSYSIRALYDHSHLEVLTTIAAQASVAIQNAQLFAKTDEALCRQVQEMDLILRTTTEGMLLMDMDWQVIAVNDALIRFLERDRCDLVGKVLTADDPEGHPSLLALLRYDADELENDCFSLLAGKTGGIKKAIILPGGIKRNVERTIAPVFNRGGGALGWLIVVRDISEEVKLARLRDDMMHMLIHDLRSPLTTLVSSLVMLRDMFESGDIDECEKVLEIAERGGERMLSLVNELLEINKLESGMMTLSVQEASIEPIIREVVSQVSPLAYEAQLSIDMLLASDLPPLTIDVPQFQRVITNILDNAIKFTPNGGRILISAELDQYKEGMVRLSIQDNGPGIPEEDRLRVFQKFQRVASVKGRRQGTGLGLAFCKLAVEAHQGEIWVESREMSGSTFVIRLPVVCHPVQLYA